MEQQNEQYGKELWKNNPNLCCHIRKVEPMKENVQQYHVWMTALRRSQTEQRADIPVLGWDWRYELLKFCPLASWTRPDVWNYIQKNDVPFNQFTFTGLSQRQLLSLHQTGSRHESRSGCSRRPLGRKRKNRVWITLFDLKNHHGKKKKTDPSKVEIAKTESRFLRGTIDETLKDPEQDCFAENDLQLLKFHGSYQAG